VPFLVAKVACSVVLALILKHSDQLGLSRLAVIRVNYGMAAVLAFLVLLGQPQPTVARNTIWVALLGGISYAAALILWARVIREGGLALTVGLNRLAIVIPVLFSIVLWHEMPRWHQALGIVLSLVATVIVGREGTRTMRNAGRGMRNEKGSRTNGTEQDPSAAPRESGVLRRQLLLAGMFVAAGAANLSSKLFDELCPPDQNMQFQVLLFVTAFIVATILYYRQREHVSRPIAQWGALLGVVNLGSSIFTILALVALTGTIAFPVSAALEVALIALLSRFVWKEPLSRLSIAGLALTVVSLVLVQVR
jgi:drug/metabolite transporter (DMT)-like permease